MNNIVVFGTSRGIGKEVVLQLAQNPENKIYAFSRKKCKEFEGKNNVVFHALDLQSPSLKIELENALQDCEKIDFALNNAGHLVSKAFLDLTGEDIQACYDVNVLGVMKCTQVLVPKMAFKGGHILNISSMGGFQGSVKFAGLSAYSTSKAAICSFTELFSEEYKESKIAMNCLCLGAVQTEMLEEAFPGYEAPHGPDQMATFIVDFLLTGHRFFKGKILPVSLSTP
ncbi:MAG: 3-oxoacyl-[acyl-carrier protein] reductase [Lentimonas sp.]|jgi:3-oxoacyl-[acyl-carrier protein] reductase